MVAFGDTRSTAKAADVLVKIHSKAVGIEPLSGKPYDANDPQSQLWIHLTAWHSILYAYEKYGPGRLSAEEEAQYWHECAIGAELQTCDPADVPRSREGVRDYFEQMRPQLVGSRGSTVDDGPPACTPRSCCRRCPAPCVRSRRSSRGSCASRRSRRCRCGCARCPA